jgi:predicted  nucleic acid-binding Zn-ribbon protein
MVTLEQVKLLETKVAKAIDFVNRVTDENTLLKGKLETYRKRIDELEGSVQRFKEDQGRIEDGILSALERLNQFEDVIGRSLSTVQAAVEKSAPAAPPESAAGPSLAKEQDSASEEDPIQETEESDEAIMAALEAEEAAAKTGHENPSSGEDNSSVELDIF